MILAIIFIREFIRNSKQVGSIVPSSEALSRKMLASIPFEYKLVIVELGAGTGVFTFDILQKLNKQSVLIVFESNPTFFKKLQNTIKHPQVILVNDCAINMAVHLKKFGFSTIDYIISSLPLTSISETDKNSILQSAQQLLRNKGMFIQYQYSLTMSNSIKSVFRSVKIGFELFNLPPAFIFSCTKT